MRSTLKFTAFVLFIGVSLYTSCKKKYMDESISRPNQLPLANAGPDLVITLPTDSVSLDGSSSSDPDGTISGYLWTKITGPASLTIIDTAGAKTVVKNLTPGVYQFELKVTDSEGLSAKDTMRVMVDSVITSNHPPIANAGPDQAITLPTDSVLLDGISSRDPDGKISNYLWRKITGPASFAIINSSTSITIVKNLTAGVYEFELKVTDSTNLFAKDTVRVTVTTNALAAQTLTVNAGPDIIITLPLDSVYLGGWASLFPVTFQWTKISGPPAVAITHPDSYMEMVLVKGLIPGHYSFRLEVSNGTGMSADTINVLVIDDPQDLNTITFKNLKWHFADEYGTGYQNLDITTSYQPNLFASWDQLRPVEIYLQLNPASPWFILPSVVSGISYGYDAAKPVVWVARTPEDSTWVGKESSIKIKLL